MRHSGGCTTGALMLAASLLGCGMLSTSVGGASARHTWADASRKRGGGGRARHAALHGIAIATRSHRLLGWGFAANSPPLARRSVGGDFANDRPLPLRTRSSALADRARTPGSTSGFGRLPREAETSRRGLPVPRRRPEVLRRLTRALDLVHSTSASPDGQRARVAGGAEEPLLARRVRSSKRRRHGACAAPRRRRTPTRSRRLSLRLRERLCSPAQTPLCRRSSNREEI